MDFEDLERAARLAAEDQRAMVEQELNRALDETRLLTDQADAWHKRATGLNQHLMVTIPMVMGSALATSTLGLFGNVGPASFIFLFITSVATALIFLAMGFCQWRRVRALSQAETRLEEIRERAEAEGLI